MSSADDVRRDDLQPGDTWADVSQMEQRRRMRRRLELENERLLALETARRRAAERKRLAEPV